jgi:spore germination protein YaaH
MIISQLIISLFLISTPASIQERSIHAQDLELHRNMQIPQRTFPPPPAIKPWALTHVVYGYLPYWISDTDSFRWEDLTHIGWFSIELDTDGSIVNTRGWPDHTLVQTAHDAGVQVEIVFTLFGSTDIDTLLSSSTSRTTCITNMVDEMEVGDADGINIDFEFVPSTARANFVSFLQELRSELDTRGHLTATISFAGPTSVSDGLDFPAIFDILDYYFIMAYGYHWSGSTYAGPVGQIRTSSDWAAAGALSLLRSLAYITKAVGENHRSKIIAGLPYYGREWITTTDSWPVQAQSHIGSVTYAAVQTLLSEGKTRYFDDSICNPVIIWQDGSDYHQVWYDDEESLECKYRLIKEQNLGGVGYWALGYDGSHPQLWDLIEEHFTTFQPWGEGYKNNPILIDAFPYSDSKDTSIEGYRYFNFYSCNMDLPEYGREFVYQFDICESGTFSASVGEDPNIDPDIHLLSDLSEEACIDRGHLELERVLSPGRYYVAIDTYVDGSVELEGTYNVNMNFTPTTAGGGCPTDTTCLEGECVCDNNLTMCDDICVDTITSMEHCGICGNSCSTQCIDGVCTLDPENDAGTDSQTDVGNDADVDPPPCETTYDCACKTVSAPAKFPFSLFGLLLFLGILRKSI